MSTSPAEPATLSTKAQMTAEASRSSAATKTSTAASAAVNNTAGANPAAREPSLVEVAPWGGCVEDRPKTGPRLEPKARLTTESQEEYAVKGFVQYDSENEPHQQSEEERSPSNRHFARAGRRPDDEGCRRERREEGDKAS